MPGGDGEFLEAIRAAPDDDSLKQVYADWLEDRGDGRGEYLRTELAMATESPFVPRYWELKERRNEFRATADPGWLEAVGYPTYYTPMFGRIPRKRPDRWRLMDRFIDFWHEKPLTPASGNTEGEIADREAELGGTLPEALREWYLLAGRRLDPWSHQNRNLTLDELRLDGEALVFRQHPLGVSAWNIWMLDDSEDPEVRVADAHVDEPTRGSVSEFALQQLILTVEMRWSRRASIPRDAVRRWFERVLQPADELSGMYLGYWPTRLFEGPDVLLLDSEREALVTLVVRDEGSLDAFEEPVQALFERHLAHPAD